MPTGEQQSLLSRQAGYGATQSAPAAPERDRDDIDIDVPVHLTQFRDNIRQCKAALVLTLSAALGTGIWHLTRLPVPHKLGSSIGGWYPAAVWGCDLTALVFTVSFGVVVSADTTVY